MELKEYKGSKDNQKFLERCFVLLSYLRKNTDKNHPTTQTELRKTQAAPYLGNRETFNRTMRQLAMTLNFKGSEVKPEEDWVLSYNAFSKYYGEGGGFYSDNDDSDNCKMSSSVRGIYFNHIFLEDELTDIINALRTSRAVDLKRAEGIIKKLKDRLTSKFYKEPEYKLKISEYSDSPKLADNIRIIQKAISQQRQVSYIFNYYNRYGKLVPTRTGRTQVSPHYIVGDKGHFYLIGGYKDSDDLCVNRIDLMTDLRLSADHRQPIPAQAKHLIKNMPLVMDDEFKIKHLNMSFNAPIHVSLKNTKTNRDGDPNYTFIHDNFGDEVFKYVDTKDNIINMQCSEFGIINFAIQYGDYVEVLDKEVREEIAKRVRVLSEKYL